MTKYFLMPYKDTVFYVDGSLRDIYVKNTSIEDWECLMDFLKKSEYSIQYIVEGERKIIPERVEEIFHQQQPSLLRIDQEHLALNSHFFVEEEIEFDLDPDLINSDRQLARLIDFIRILGRLLKKEVFLTPENMPDYPLFHFDPLANTEVWL